MCRERAGGVRAPGERFCPKRERDFGWGTDGGAYDPCVDDLPVPEPATASRKAGRLAPLRLYQGGRCHGLGGYDVDRVQAFGQQGP